VIRGAVTIGFLHPGHWQACFANSLNELMFYDATTSCRVVGNPDHRFGLMGNEATATQIPAGRNKIARTVLDESESEWLFMVDADMGFAPDTVERLVRRADRMTRPVVGGLAFANKSDGTGPFYARRYRAVPTLYKMYETDDEVGFVPDFDYPRDRVVQVDATGCACLLVHRSALENIRDAHGDHWFDPIRLPKGKDGFTDFGEDMSFCLRLAACGIPLHVDTSVKTTHDKGGVFLDEEVYDLQQAMKALTDG
jgi:GT2 family glycosyltransferase